MEQEKNEKTIVFDENQVKETLLEDEQYIWVTPHYTRNAILTVLIAMIAGMVISYFVFNANIKDSTRQAYLQQGYIVTKNANAESKDIAIGKKGYVNGQLVVGTLEENNSSAATASASDVVEGYTGYVNGEKITGTIKKYNGTLTFTPSSSNQTINCKGLYLKNSIIIKGDDDLVAENIREGVTIFGIKGTYVGQ